MKETQIVPIDRLTGEPYARVLCFPKPHGDELQSRIRELNSLGVTALEFSGKASLFGVGLPVLGKGFVGIVVAARIGEEKVAVKIRRMDADRADLLHEAKMLKVANAINVAPKLFSVSKNFLVMQLVDSETLPEWLPTKGDPTTIRQVLGDVLEQCFRLDQAGLDHGELSKAPKHVLVDKAEKPFIVDFETGSTERRTANVTAICQYLFASNSSTCKTLAEMLGERDRLRLLEALKAYKNNKTRFSFDSLLQVCLAKGV